MGNGLHYQKKRKKKRGIQTTLLHSPAAIFNSSDIAFCRFQAI